MSALCFVALKGRNKIGVSFEQLYARAVFTNLTKFTTRKRDLDMPQSLSSILIHLIFSTKNREPFLTPEVETELYPYMAAISTR